MGSGLWRVAGRSVAPVDRGGGGAGATVAGVASGTVVASGAVRDQRSRTTAAAGGGPSPGGGRRVVAHRAGRSAAQLRAVGGWRQWRWGRRPVPTGSGG